MAVRKRRLSATVVSIESIAVHTCRMRLAAPELAASAHAGHFVNILIPQAAEVLWRRPYSIHAADRQAGIIELLFNDEGRGSQALSRVKPGTSVELLGLLGNSFKVPDELEEAIIIAGGLGMAPFRLLLQDLADTKIRKTLFWGVASQDRLCCLEELSALGAGLHISTEDGSMGQKGFVTAAAESYLAQAPRQGRMLYVCGPTAMLARVQELAARFGVSGQVSVENRMACGFGACMGCPVELAEPQPTGVRYRLACKDGPVFPLNEISFHD
jgi:dihydroorotate dehydrogenase electron transfer subunit